MALLPLLAAALLGAPDARPPNFVLILADDLGYGDLGCYGQERIQTPALDQLAAEGLRFTRFYAGSTVCAPSRCALMTGLHTGHCWIRGNGGPPLRGQDVTVAEVLQVAGYATGLIGKWGLGEEGTEGHPNRQGFDEFFGYLNQRHAHNYYTDHLFRGEERVPIGNDVDHKGSKYGGVARDKQVYSHDLFTAEALDFVERHQDHPFFLYLAYTIPHANNEAGKAGMEVPDLGGYADEDWPEPQKGHAAMISRLDRDVGRLVAKLDELGLGEQTVVMFTSDNGPHQEGGARVDFFDSNGPLRGLKRDLTDGGVRVPMIVRWPGHVAAGTTTDVLSAQWDLLPTLAELAMVKPAGILDGVSLVPVFEGKAQPVPHDHLYWAFYERGGAQAVCTPRWKALAKPAHAEPVLYDLLADPGETTDVAAAHPEVVGRLKALMRESYTPTPQWRFPHEEKDDGGGQVSARSVEPTQHSLVAGFEHPQGKGDLRHLHGLRLQAHVAALHGSSKQVPAVSIPP